MATNKKKHLRKEERFCIEKMLQQNKSFGEVVQGTPFFAHLVNDYL